MDSSKRFFLRTYGCQMNVHDSEKVANLLYHHGYGAADRLEDAGLLIVNTCSIRDKAEQRLYSDLGLLRAWKDEAPDRILGVGGCVAQQQGDALLRRFDHVDFVFGTHSLRLVAAMAAAARAGSRSTRVDQSGSLERFDLPEWHPDFPGSAPGRGYVTAMEGCDLFCSFCVVPATRGREISRPAEAIIREVESLAGRGVREVTLLGQTVNAYGRHQTRREAAAERGGRRAARGRGPARAGEGRTPAAGSAARTVPFASLLRRLARIPGIARLRYTSPHPLFFDDDLIRAHGDLPALCPHVHLPVQSGSDAVLARMRRRYTAAHYRGLIDRIREARPDIAITTDLIVAFPGETDADFRQTLSLVRDVGFVDSFSFKYSPRPGTAAATSADSVPEPVAQARLEELLVLQRRLTLAAHRARVGEETEILVEGPSRRGGAQLSGRDPYQRVVNFSPDAAFLPPPGALIPVRIVEATPHSLIGEFAAEEWADAARRPVKGGAPPADEQGRSGAFGKRRPRST